jgi:hypothetical protein
LCMGSEPCIEKALRSGRLARALGVTLDNQAAGRLKVLLRARVGPGS